MFIAQVFAVIFSLIAYRVSVHFAQVPEAGDVPASSAPVEPVAMSARPKG